MDADGEIGIVDSNGKLVSRQRIVQCVNAHDELVALLEQAAEALKRARIQLPTGLAGAGCQLAINAIAKATGSAA